VVTGAAAYDHWFSWRPRESRDAFCARIGLPADKPYLLYLCSSKFIAPDEVEFVRRWIADVRASSGVLHHVSVLVRPHPQNTAQWDGIDLGVDRAVVWPRSSENPVDEESRSVYYDSIHHSAAVVGVNTSAQIESAIIGREVFTLLSPDFQETQDGTLHFQHLRDAGGGLLHVAASVAEHAAQLEAAVAGPTQGDRGRRFVEAFVRPFGIDQAATPRLVAALEAVGAKGACRRDDGPWWAPLLQPVLSRASLRLARTLKARKEKGRRQERIKAERDAELIERRAALVETKQTAAREREQRNRLPRDSRWRRSTPARSRPTARCASGRAGGPRLTPTPRWAAPRPSGGRSASWRQCGRRRRRQSPSCAGTAGRSAVSRRRTTNRQRHL
jgi:hypothetical protein